MFIRVSDFHCKEVICISDGRRLGFVSDMDIEIPSGRICNIIVPGPGRIFGVLGPRDDFVIPWNCIKRIGPDIILVDAKPDDCKSPRQGPSKFLG